MKPDLAPPPRQAGIKKTTFFLGKNSFGGAGLTGTAGLATIID
jgi:hypothetical protein